MPLYEHVFLARQDISAQQVEGLVQEFRNIIESGGGSIGKTEYWGLKGLTFRIKKNRKAHFSLINIDASFFSAVPSAVLSNQSLNDISAVRCLLSTTLE